MYWLDRRVVVPAELPEEDPSPDLSAVTKEASKFLSDHDIPLDVFSRVVLRLKVNGTSNK